MLTNTGGTAASAPASPSSSGHALASSAPRTSRRASKPRGAGQPAGDGALGPAELPGLLSASGLSRSHNTSGNRYFSSGIRLTSSSSSGGQVSEQPKAGSPAGPPQRSFSRAPGSKLPGVECSASGRAVQIIAEDRPRRQTGGAANEDQKGGLKSVVGVGGVAEHPATDAQHHRAMTPHQDRECRLIAVAHETRQELPVGLQSRQRATAPLRSSGPSSMSSRWVVMHCPAGPRGRFSSIGASGSDLMGELCRQRPERLLLLGRSKLGHRDDLLHLPRHRARRLLRPRQWHQPPVGRS